jgi:hypothetical protein
MFALDAGTFDSFGVSSGDTVVDNVDFSLQLHDPHYFIEKMDADPCLLGFLLEGFRRTPKGMGSDE